MNPNAPSSNSCLWLDFRDDKVHEHYKLKQWECLMSSEQAQAFASFFQSSSHETNDSLCLPVCTDSLDAFTLNLMDDLQHPDLLVQGRGLRKLYQKMKSTPSWWARTKHQNLADGSWKPSFLSRRNQPFFSHFESPSLGVLIDLEHQKVFDYFHIGPRYFLDLMIQSFFLFSKETPSFKASWLAYLHQEKCIQSQSLIPSPKTTSSEENPSLFNHSLTAEKCIPFILSQLSVDDPKDYPQAAGFLTALIEKRSLQPTGFFDFFMTHCPMLQSFFNAKTTFSPPTSQNPYPSQPMDLFCLDPVQFWKLYTLRMTLAERQTDVFQWIETHWTLVDTLDLVEFTPHQERYDPTICLLNDEWIERQRTQSFKTHIPLALDLLFNSRRFLRWGRSLSMNAPEFFIQKLQSYWGDRWKSTLLEYQPELMNRMADNIRSNISSFPLWELWEKEGTPWLPFLREPLFENLQTQHYNQFRRQILLFKTQQIHDTLLTTIDSHPSTSSEPFLLPPPKIKRL